MKLQGRAVRCASGAWRTRSPSSVTRITSTLRGSSGIDFRIRIRAPTRDAFLKAATTRPTSNLAIDVSGEAVGAIGYVPGVDVERYSAEIGYWLGESYWGGIATEALVLVTATSSTP